MVLCGGRKGFCIFPKRAKREGFVRVSQKRRQAWDGRLTRICEDAFRVAGAVQENRDMFIRDVGTGR